MEPDDLQPGMLDVLVDVGHLQLYAAESTDLLEELYVAMQRYAKDAQQGYERLEEVRAALAGGQLLLPALADGKDEARCRSRWRLRRQRGSVQTRRR